MRVLLTGCTGFVGKQILSQLLLQGTEVSAIIRSGKEAPRNVNPIWTDDLFQEPVDFFEVACSDHDAVIHAAWYAVHQKYLDSPRNLNCLEGTLRLFRAAQNVGVSHFHGIGSCLEYDLYTERLEQKLPLTTEDPIRPTTVYGASKAAAGLVMLNHQGPMMVAWSRLFFLSGEGEHPDRLIPYIKSRLEAGLSVELRNGGAWRDFIDVIVASAQITQITHQLKQGAFNICSGNAITIREIAYALALKYGRPDLIKISNVDNRRKEPEYIVGIPSMEVVNVR